MWFLPLKVLKREAIHIDEVNQKYKLFDLNMPQTEFPIVTFTDIPIGSRWYPFRYIYLDNMYTKYQISALWCDQQWLFLYSLGFFFALVVLHLFCLEILCGDILLSNSNPQPFNAQSLRPSANSHENTKNTGSSTEK